jgi:hypothetical protein
MSRLSIENALAARGSSTYDDNDVTVSNMSIGDGTRDLFVNKYINDGKIYVLKNGQKFGGDNELDIFNGEHKTSVFPFDSLDYPKDFTINPFNEKIYVLLDDNIVILDNGLTNETLGEIKLPEETNFNHIVFNPSTNELYLTDRSSNKVFVVNEKNPDNYTTFAVGKHYLGGVSRYIKKIDINSNIDTIYVVDREAEKLYLVNTSSHTPIAGIKFSVIPKFSGDIYCNGKPAAVYVKFPSNHPVNCVASSKEGFKFVSWKGDRRHEL